ncbi:DinB family protein [Falsibacillus albus]|uniref:DinB family protein n=1 Tax=Falsibacillus albus TaxID=2478915 RepID=A0A3L7JRC8_9BACI|nr:DinB family protein [Falsibacillus albus]RLQ91092.1 DinB family protein [Falsibacillus albus]
MNRKTGIKQLQITRGALLKFLQEIDEETAAIQPKGFNNTLQWHTGHILTAAESFMFGKEFEHLPKEYTGLFGYGSKPSDWTAAAPSIRVMEAQLKEQSERIQALPEEVFEKNLPEPFIGLETVGELYGMMIYHEAEHLGQMKAMKRILDAE